MYVIVFQSKHTHTHPVPILKNEYQCSRAHTSFCEGKERIFFCGSRCPPRITRPVPRACSHLKAHTHSPRPPRRTHSAVLCVALFSKWAGPGLLCVRRSIQTCLRRNGDMSSQGSKPRSGSSDGPAAPSHAFCFIFWNQWEAEAAINSAAGRRGEPFEEVLPLSQQENRDFSRRREDRAYISKWNVSMCKTKSINKAREVWNWVLENFESPFEVSGLYKIVLSNGTSWKDGDVPCRVCLIQSPSATGGREHLKRWLV